MQYFPSLIHEKVLIINNGQIVNQIKKPINESMGHILIESFEVINIIKILSVVLMEEKLVLVGSSMSKISHAIEGIVQLIKPLKWLHTLV